MEKIETTSTIIPSSWNRGHPGLAREKREETRHEGAGRSLTYLHKVHLEWHLEPSSWMGSEMKKWK